jgi:hypothetical protein
MGLIQQRLENLPDILGHNLVTLRRGVNAIFLIAAYLLRRRRA